MSFNWKTMPKALSPSSPLPHEGTLDEEAQAHLRSLGYDVVDVRTTMGRRQVELMLQGVALGTVEADNKRLTVLKESRQLWSKLSKEEAEEGLKGRVDKPDVLTLLARAPSAPTPTSRRGRPPGSGNKP